MSEQRALYDPSKSSLQHPYRETGIPESTIKWRVTMSSTPRTKTAYRICTKKEGSDPCQSYYAVGISPHTPIPWFRMRRPMRLVPARHVF